MITKKCGVCGQQAILEDAGVEAGKDRFASRFICSNGHVERREKMRNEAERKVKGLEKINQLLDEVEAVADEKPA